MPIGNGEDWANDYSASPLNGEAAELWDKDPEEFKKKVLGRHRDVTDDE